MPFPDRPSPAPSCHCHLRCRAEHGIRSNLYQRPGSRDALEPVVVTATRNKSREGETPQKVTIITREEIEQQLAITQDPSQVLSNLIPSYSPSRQKLKHR